MKPTLRIAIALFLAQAAILAGSAPAAAQAVAQAAQGALVAPAADEILARLDANESFKAIRYAGRMEISSRGKTKVKIMEAVAMGSDKAFIEFTNPEDRGVRYLKLDKDLWMYFPKEQDTVKISGQLLKNGMMGSDVSYEDALESSDWKAKYGAAVKGSDTVDGRKAWILELTAKLPTASYERILVWVDAERFVRLKEEMYAKSGILLKTSRSLDFKRIDGRWLATRTELSSVLRKDSKTVFIMDEVQLDPQLDPRQFTTGELTK